MSPVVIEFHDKKDKLDAYSVMRAGLENSGTVITEDSRCVCYIYDLHGLYCQMDLSPPKQSTPNFTLFLLFFHFQVKYT